MKYAHYNEQTLELLGWYSEDVHGENIPLPNIQIEDEAWQAAIDTNANKVDSENGLVFYEECFKSFKDRRVSEESESHHRVLSCDISLNLLGDDYAYPSEYFNDLSLYQYIATGEPARVKCRTLYSDQWSFVTHDNSQIKTIASAFLNKKQDALEAIEKIKNAAEDCTTKEELETALSRL